MSSDSSLPPPWLFTANRNLHSTKKLLGNPKIPTAQPSPTARTCLRSSPAYTASNTSSSAPTTSTGQDKMSQIPTATCWESGSTESSDENHQSSTATENNPERSATSEM